MSRNPYLDVSIMVGNGKFDPLVHGSYLAARQREEVARQIQQQSFARRRRGRPRRKLSRR